MLLGALVIGLEAYSVNKLCIIWQEGAGWKRESLPLKDLPVQGSDGRGVRTGVFEELGRH